MQCDAHDAECQMLYTGVTIVVYRCHYIQVSCMMYRLTYM